MGPFRHVDVAWKWTQLGVLWGEGVWDKGHDESRCSHVPLRNLGQMASRLESCRYGQVRARLQRPVSGDITIDESKKDT